MRPSPGTALSNNDLITDYRILLSADNTETLIGKRTVDMKNGKKWYSIGLALVITVSTVFCGSTGITARAAGNEEIAPEDVSVTWEDSRVYTELTLGQYETMTTYGVNACPPCLVGIGIAGSAEVAAKLSKKALLRPVGSHNENPKAAQMEKDIEDGLNSIGLGPGGFGGKLSVMGVNIEQAARHPATLAVGMSTACWAHRRAGITISPDFSYDFFTHKGVTL